MRGSLPSPSASTRSTAHDSYRPPLSYADAIVELRRVSGTQLDARLVEIFIGIVVGSAIGILGASGGREAEMPAPRRAVTARRDDGPASAGRGSSSGC